MIVEGKRAAAGAFIRDGASRLLIVKPTYREGWMIPGGMVEAGESPREACVRELQEELGLKFAPASALVVDYVGPSDRATDMLHFIFDGGILNEDVARRITLDAREHSAFQFAPIDLALELLTERLSLRLRRWLNRPPGATSIYFETDYPLPHARREQCAPHIRDAALRLVVAHHGGTACLLPDGIGPRTSLGTGGQAALCAVEYRRAADEIHLHFGPATHEIMCTAH